MRTFLLGVLLYIVGLMLCVSLLFAQEVEYFLIAEVPSFEYTIKEVDAVFAQQQEARMMQGVVGGSVPAAGGACTDADPDCATFAGLVCQNFETATTGYDNSESWVESELNGGVVDPIDGTATVLRGSQQLQITGAGGSSSRTSFAFTPQDTVWVHFMFKPGDADAGTQRIMSLHSGGMDASGCNGTIQANLEIRITSAARLYHGTIFLQTDNPIFANNTAIHLWVKYVKGTGSDGVIEFYWSADGTRPSLASVCYNTSFGSGQPCTRTTGDSTGQIGCISLEEYNGVVVKYFDQVLVRAAEIGNVCVP